MMYRVWPLGETHWTVQRRLFGLFWATLYSLVGYDTYGPYCFDTEAEADAWIIEQFRARQSEIRAAEVYRDRKRRARLALNPTHGKEPKDVA